MAERRWPDVVDGLPASLADAVQACVNASGLSGEMRAALARELSSHMFDAIDAGKSEQEIVREFGDAKVAGALIGRARGTVGVWPRRVATSVASLGVAAMLMLYVGSAVALHARSPTVAATTADRDRIASLAESPFDLQAASTVVADLLDRMYSHQGTLTAEGLRIVQRLKGVDHITTTALVAEPAYFVLPASREEVGREWGRLARLAASARVNGPSSSAWRSFEAEVARFSWARRDGFRYAPLAIVLPRLIIALRSEAAR